MRLRRFGSFPSPITCSCLLTVLSSSSRMKWTICPEIPTSEPRGRKEKSGQSLSQSSLPHLGTQDWFLEQFMPHSSSGFPLPSFFYPTQRRRAIGWVVAATEQACSAVPEGLALPIQSDPLFLGYSILDIPKSGVFLSYSGSLLFYLMFPTTWLLTHFCLLAEQGKTWFLLPLFIAPMRYL